MSSLDAQILSNGFRMSSLPSLICNLTAPGLEPIDVYFAGLPNILPGLDPFVMVDMLRTVLDVPIREEMGIRRLRQAHRYDVVDQVSEGCGVENRDSSLGICSLPGHGGRL